MCIKFDVCVGMCDVVIECMLVGFNFGFGGIVLSKLFLVKQGEDYIIFFDMYVGFNLVEGVLGLLEVFILKLLIEV